MSVTKVINIEVRDAELKQLENELNKVGASFNQVEGESKKASKGIKDVGENGGAISTLDSLTGGLATRIRDAAEASKLFNVNLKATRAALLATGIGAFVVVLGTVAVLWDDIVAAIQDVNGKLQKQIDASIRLQDIYSAQLDVIDKQIALNEKQGLINDELQAQRIELVKQLRAENDEEIKKLELQAENIKLTALELNTREKNTKDCFKYSKCW